MKQHRKRKEESGFARGQRMVESFGKGKTKRKEEPNNWFKFFCAVIGMVISYHFGSWEFVGLFLGGCVLGNMGN